MRKFNFYSLFLFIYFFMLLGNIALPLCVGDDYVYSFVWDSTPGWNLFSPLSPDAVRIGSWDDIFHSQLAHYFSWGGRMVSHTIAQFFLWQGDMMFNLVNAAVFVLLLGEIYVVSYGGRAAGRYEADRLGWCFFVVWAFVLGFAPVIFWLEGACNYLWQAAILLGFLLPYIRGWLSESMPPAHQGSQCCLSAGMFLWGLVAGCNNENVVCWWLALLALGLYQLHKEGRLERWMLFGVGGLILGYAILIAAPGNYVREAYELSGGNAQTFSAKFIVFALITGLQSFLWLFVGGALCRHKIIFGNETQGKRYLRLCLAFAAVSLASLLVMLFVPNFPARAGFASTISLVCAAALLLGWQQKAGISILDRRTRRFLHILGAAYLFFSVTMSVVGWTAAWQQENSLAAAREAAQREMAAGGSSVFAAPAAKLPEWLNTISAWHAARSTLSTEPESWKNKAYAYYYGFSEAYTEK